MSTTKQTPKYAAGTSVSISKSREEIERLLKKYGATGFMYGTQENTAAVVFEMHGRRYRIMMEYPGIDQFRRSRTGARTPIQAENALDQEIRRRWRAMVMIIKAKLEAVESGIRTIEQEFLYDTVMANDQTVGEWIEPQVQQMYQSGAMPKFLPGVKYDDLPEIDPPDIIDAR